MDCTIRSVNEDDDDGLSGRNGKTHRVRLGEGNYRLIIKDDGSIVTTTPSPYIDGEIRRYL